MPDLRVIEPPAPAPPAPPRRGADTRARLLGAAIEVLESGGYASASVAAIAERAGMATGTLYRHFASKSQLFAELFRAIGDAELAAMEKAAQATHTAAEELEAVIATFAGRALSRPRLAWALVYEPLDVAVDVERLRYRRAYALRMAAFLRERVEAGELPDQDPDTTAAALIGGIAEALVSPLSPVAGGNADPDAVIAALTAFCRRAVGAEAPEGPEGPRGASG
jgi:AcrR family transcriptional regulator